MIIKNLTPLLPANVVLELEDGTEHELFVMVHLPSSTVLIPDEEQYRLVEGRYDEFARLIQSQVTKTPVINLPAVPDAVMQRVQSAREKGDRQREFLDKMREEIETSERFPSEEEIADIIKEEIQKAQEDKDAL